MPVTTASATNTGRRRSTNEENLSIRQDLALFIVADEMSGHAAGEVASRTVVERIVVFGEAASEIPPDHAWSVQLDPEAPFDPKQAINRNSFEASFCLGNHKVTKAALWSELQTSRKLSMGATGVAHVGVLVSPGGRSGKRSRTGQDGLALR